MVKEHIARLQISMQDFPFFSIMTFFESQYDLHENLPNDILGHEVFVLFALLNKLGHISILTVLHDDVYSLVLFIHNPLTH
jgi:hypothetical protein